mmetsp:Transcript_123585/g.349970  ORF Transcript_123585/g.349970 Transcript_123585/m.349970 type:complete len:223 (-) Transcript_123585:208-876(-)
MASEMIATTTALRSCAKRCVAPSEVFRDVRTKTPVGGMAPTAPQTAWPTMRPRSSFSSLKGRSMRPAAILAEMSVSRTATIAMLRDGMSISRKDAPGDLRGWMISGFSSPYLLFRVSRSNPRRPWSQSTPRTMEKMGTITVQGTLGILRMRNHRQGVVIRKRIREAGTVSSSVVIDSTMFMMNSLCFLSGTRPHAKLIWFRPMISATPTVKPSKTEVGIRSM